MLKSLFKRSATHFSGLVLGQAISTLVFIFLARVLLPAKFGQFVLATTMVQIATVLGDLGLKQWYQKHAFLLNREKLFAKTIFTRLITVLLCALVLGIILYFKRSFDLNSSILLLIILLPHGLLSTTDAYHLEKKDSKKVGLRSTSTMLVFIVVYYLLGLPRSLDAVLIAWLLGLLATIFWFFPWGNLIYFKYFSLKDAFNNLKESSAYAVLTVTSLFYTKGDSLIIEKLQGPLALGFYGGAYRFLDAINLLPSTISQNLFPIAAKKGNLSKDQLKKMTLSMVLFGFMVAVLLYASSDFIVNKILGIEYLPSLAVLKIFSLVVFMFFLNSPLASVVQSSDMIKKFLPFGLANTLLNLLLNVVLVKQFGFIAAAWVMLFTELTGLVINIYFVKKIYAK